MSCKPGVPSFSVNVGNTPRYVFPTFKVNGNFSETIKLNIPDTKIFVTLKNFLEQAKIRLPRVKLNDVCTDEYISPSIDFKNDDIGGIPWPPMCLDVTSKKKCKRIFGKTFCVKVPTGIQASYTKQPYWEIDTINIPDNKIIDFEIPNIEIGMKLDVKSITTIGGFVTSQSLVLKNLIDNIINKSIEGFTLNTFLLFLNAAIAATSTLTDFKSFSIVCNVFNVSVNIVVKECYIKIGKNTINIPDFNINKTLNILGGPNGSYLSLNISPPDEVSFDINLITINVWEQVVFNMKNNPIVKMGIVSRLNPFLGTLFIYYIDNYSDGTSDIMNPITNWLNDHIIITVNLYGKLCPLNPVPNTQFLICSAINTQFIPFTQREIEIIMNKVDKELTTVIDYLNKLKLSRSDNDDTKYVLQFCGLPKGAGFNEIIARYLDKLPKIFRDVFLLVLEAILSLNVTISASNCVIPPPI